MEETCQTLKDWNIGDSLLISFHQPRDEQDWRNTGGTTHNKQLDDSDTLWANERKYFDEYDMFYVEE